VPPVPPVPPVGTVEPAGETGRLERPGATTTTPGGGFR